ncbi:MAG TPA: NAD(+) synthase, partial [Geobacteraceae bacterium]|nr:NAD(+) synthase [Geobacteraceae bacterium]
MSQQHEFVNLYNHNFVRTAVVLPKIKVADPGHNSKETIALLRQASENNALLAVFPELGLSAYTCDDLFHQQTLLDGCLAGLDKILEASQALSIIGIVGLPLRIDGLLFNCAVVFYQGRVLGVVPKTYLPNYREFYEMRQFSPADHSLRERIELLNQRDVPFGNRLVFQIENQPLLSFYIEICEDVWVPIPPSSHAALAGATVLVNLSASNITVGKADYRRQLVANQSGRCLAAYLYSAAGFGESTTDLAWDGHGMIYENGSAVAESKRFSCGEQIIYGDLDLDRLVQERMRQNSFGQSVNRFREVLKEFRSIKFAIDVPREEKIPLGRRYERFPFVPSDPDRRDERCREVYEIQVQALVQRFKTSGADKMVIGISGGL